mgnify:CR=1 FL=1
MIIMIMGTMKMGAAVVVAAVAAVADAELPVLF